MLLSGYLIFPMQILNVQKLENEIIELTEKNQFNMIY